MIRDYWKAHPEEQKEFMAKLEKKLESLRNEQKAEVEN
jgi:hypothetical protein